MGPAAILLGGRGLEPRPCPQANVRGTVLTDTPPRVGAAFKPRYAQTTALS
jgi:hypothetical protein